jgi:hypothetical protein
MKAGMEYGFLVGVFCGLGATIPAMGPVVLGLLTLHFSWGILRMGRSRLWFSAAGTLLFLVGIWLVWPLETWSDAIRSARLVPAIIAMVGGLLLYWAQRRNTRKRSPCPVATR